MSALAAFVASLALAVISAATGLSVQGEGQGALPERVAYADAAPEPRPAA